MSRVWLKNTEKFTPMSNTYPEFAPFLEKKRACIIPRQYGKQKLNQKFSLKEWTHVRKIQGILVYTEFQHLCALLIM